MLVGIDIGGTFTDIFLYDEEIGEATVTKVLSTPPHFAEGVFTGLKKAEVEPKRLMRICHGSTIVDNILTERRLPKIALIITEGFRDLLEVGRWWREELYELQQDKPAQIRPLVKRRDIYTIEERIGSGGEIVKPLNETGIHKIISNFKTKGYESIAIFFINSYANPIHERKVHKLIRQECPDLFVSTSTDLVPIIRELPRLSTTVINACALPIVKKYVEEMLQHLRDLDFEGALLIMQSSGGMMRADIAVKRPVYIAASGPAAGVIATSHLAELLEIENSISFDMGGTTAKACALINGKYPVTTEFQFEWDLPIAVPMIDIVEVGAGGGSMAWIDEGGMLRVGPQSAGAVPGPVCYLRGGTKPTVTDANLVLRLLNPKTFLGGEMKISTEAAEQAIREIIAEPLAVDLYSAAEGIVEIANTNMNQALRAITMERGYDPRDFTLVAFGGAGPMHAAFLADELEIPKIIVPLNPAVFSAFGLCTSDLQCDFISSFLVDINQINLDQLNDAYRRLEQQALDELHKEDLRDKDIQLFRFSKMKYIGESIGRGIEVPFPSQYATKEILNKVRRKFDELHRVHYGFAVPEETVLFIDLHVRGVAKIEKVRLKEWPIEDSDVSAALKGQRKACFKRRWMDAAIYDREKLKPGNIIQGPAIVEEPTSTVIVPANFTASVGKLKDLMLIRRDKIE